MPFQRVVIEIEVGPEGRLQPRPGATWRSEPARGEASVHRRLAALADASPAQVARFASAHGFLRRAPGDLARSGPDSEGLTIAVGQEAADDAVRLEAWLVAGAIGDPPPETAEVAAMTAVIAAMPESVMDAIDALIQGEVTPGQMPPADLPTIVPIIPLAAEEGSPYLADPGRIRNLDRRFVLRALRIVEWMSRIHGGLEPVPSAIAASGGPDGLRAASMANTPEIYALDGHAAASAVVPAAETVADWHDAARDMAAHVRAIHLVRGALRPAGISDLDKRDLADLYARLAGFRSRPDLRAAEIAERTRPILASRIEADLAKTGTWPPRPGDPPVLWVRALVAALTELTDTTPGAGCATPGCLGTVPPTRNRRYCDSCRKERRRASVRRSRSTADAAGRPG